MKRKKRKNITGTMQFVSVCAIAITAVPVVKVDLPTVSQKGMTVVQVMSRELPVKNARIELIDKKQISSFHTSNQDGYAVLEEERRSGHHRGMHPIHLSSGIYSLIVTKEGFTPRKVQFYVGENDFVEKVVHLNSSNNPPVAKAGEDHFVQPFTTLTLDGSKSRDPDSPEKGKFQSMPSEVFINKSGLPNGKRIESYHWEILSKPKSSASKIRSKFKETAFFQPDTKGVYQISLTVTDGIEVDVDLLKIYCDVLNERKRDLSTPRGGHSSAIIGRKVYLTGGWNDNFLNIVEAYDFKQDDWTAKAPMAIARNHHLSFSFKGKIYVIGGHNQEFPDGIAEVEVYDPVYDKWSKAAPMPTPRYNMSGNLLNRKFYTFGGTGGRNKIEVYDPVSDTWESRPAMPTARYRHTSSLIHGKFYLIGGKGTEQLTEEYDPINNQWAVKKKMPTGRFYLSSAVLNQKIYVTGGHGRIKGEGKADVEEYDPVKNEWRSLTPLPAPLDVHTMNIYNDRIYIIGGEKKFGQPNTIIINQTYNPLFEKAVR